MDDNNQTLIPNSKKEMADEAQKIVDLDKAIKERISRIESARAELKPASEMLTSYLMGDEKYAHETDLAKKAQGLKNLSKRRLLEAPQGKDLQDKIKSIKDEIAELEEGLSYYLREYQRMTGSNEFEDQDGQLRQIVSVVKLVKKPTKKDK